MFAPNFLIFQINVIDKNLIEIKVFFFYPLGIANSQITFHVHTRFIHMKLLS